MKPNRAFNESGHDWVKLISSATAMRERGLGSGSLRPRRRVRIGKSWGTWAAQAVMVCADRSWPCWATLPRRSWVGSRLTWGEREQPRLQPVGLLGRLMNVLGCKRSPPRPVQPIHNELQFPGPPPSTSSPFLPAAARCPASKALASHGCARF